MGEQRVDENNKVKLYAGLVDDLAIKPGDLIVFVRNEQGRWEVRRGDEVALELKAVWDKYEGIDGGLSDGKAIPYC